MEQKDNNVEIIDELAKSQDFFQDNKLSERKYTTTKKCSTTKSIFNNK